MAEGATVMEIAIAIAVTVLLGTIMTAMVGIVFDLNSLSFWGVMASCVAAIGCGVLLIGWMWVWVLR